jgi:hypothetical protein
MDGKWSENPLYNTWKVQFWEWMHENSKHLYDFQVLGGEPMFQPEFEECLDFFDTHENPNMNWKMFSNLKHDTEKFKKKIDRIASLIQRKKIKSMQIVCSIDCWGPEIEYVRDGLILTEWEQNMNTLLNSPGVGVLIHATLTALTLPTLHQLIEKTNEIMTPVEEETNIPDFIYIFKTAVKIFFILIVIYVGYLFYNIFNESILTFLNTFYGFFEWIYHLFTNKIKTAEYYEKNIQDKYNRLIRKTMI